MSTISSIHARQILDSRGNPTVEVEVTLENGVCGRASVPSGASTGSHEAIELRDHQSQYHGMGVENAVHFVNNEIAGFLKGKDASDQTGIDNEMIRQDGTSDRHRFGANAILGVSLAASHAAAEDVKKPYYRYIADLYEPGIKPQLPRPMFNILNGGLHTSWQSTDIQEFMIVPLNAPSFAEALRWGDEIDMTLKDILKTKGYSTLVGDEGGFAAAVKGDEEAIQLILRAIEQAGYIPGKQIGLGIDAAASEFLEHGQYHLKLENKTFDCDGLIEYWRGWIQKYPIISLEDGLAEDDWAGWTKLNASLGSKVQILGDDLLVTSIQRIKEAISQKACNCLLMKPNQVGTLTESLQAIKTAKEAGWGVVVSHRSGET